MIKFSRFKGTILLLIFSILTSEATFAQNIVDVGEMQSFFRTSNL